MSRGFGWDLPPGCTHAMIEAQCAEYPCEVCGEYPDNCICPECPICGTNGDPECYKNHGMIRTPEQIKSLSEFLESARAEAQAEAEYEAADKGKVTERKPKREKK